MEMLDENNIAEGGEAEVRKEEKSIAPTAEESTDTAALLSEIERLKAELSESKRLNERVSEDISEFHRLFPKAELSELPSEVRESVRSGLPLTASYALYEKRIEAERARAEEINRRNAHRSSGAAGRSTNKEYFTPDEVRAMSQSEVRDNYRQIVESMKRWSK